jgi:hypothetical protein
MLIPNRRATIRRILNPFRTVPRPNNMIAMMMTSRAIIHAMWGCYHANDSDGPLPYPVALLGQVDHIPAPNTVSSMKALL